MQAFHVKTNSKNDFIYDPLPLIKIFRSDVHF